MTFFAVISYSFLLAFCCQKLLKISCFLLQSIGGALFLVRPARAFCLASAAVGLRRRLQSTASQIILSSSSGTYNTQTVNMYTPIISSLCSCFVLSSYNLSLSQTRTSSLNWMLMSELLISDGVVEPLEDWDAELPWARGFGDMFMIEGSVSVMFIIGGSVVGVSVGGGRSVYESFT